MNVKIITSYEASSTYCDWEIMTHYIKPTDTWTEWEVNIATPKKHYGVFNGIMDGYLKSHPDGYAAVFNGLDIGGAVNIWIDSRFPPDSYYYLCYKLLFDFPNITDLRICVKADLLEQMEAKLIEIEEFMDCD